MKTSILQKLVLLSLIVLAGNGILGYAVYESNQRLLRSERLIQHTEQVIYQTGNILSVTKDIETASRGFVITNDSAFLEPLYTAQKTAFNDVGQLRQLTLDNRSQQIRIDSLDLYMHKLFRFSFKIIDLRSKQGIAPAIAYTSGRQGKYFTDHIRQTSHAMQQEESRLLKLRKLANQRNTGLVNASSGAMFISMAVSTILLLIVIGKYLLQKGKRAAELVIANKELLYQNKEKERRADELTIANEELWFQNKEKEKRAAELTIANKELLFQNNEKGKRAAELTIANSERSKMVSDLMTRNSELEQFAYIISHNLRAPVANIIGATNAMNELDLSTEDKETLYRGINLSVLRLDDVVKDLNTILQVKRDVNEVREMVSFSGLVDGIKFSIRNIIEKYNIQIECDFSKINEFKTLKPYLYSIFYNLITNSIKYRSQEVDCLIKIKSNLRKNKLELIFKDNGMGIDLKKSGDQVFGLYKRFHNHIEGKGMGLFMVKTQIETLGGKISLKSRENAGTEFKIEFEIGKHQRAKRTPEYNLYAV
ncbi:MAG TPA: CHASE3 domain-containing protein [Mucilaginibacter sp.]|jgi:signal transduction histidine kinase|nr:CHASE3 domain-containing protein [Mucilaginibacter sp.]